MKSAIVTVQKNSPTLVEFLRWHLDVLKFDHVFLFEDGRLSKIPEEFADRVTQTRVRDYISSDSELPRQQACFQRFLDEHMELQDFDWALFIDDDERAWFNGETFPEFLRRLPKDWACSLALPWVFYGGEPEKDIADGYIPRFLHRQAESSDHVKLLFNFKCMAPTYWSLLRPVWPCPHCLASATMRRFIPYYIFHDGVLDPAVGPKTQMKLDCSKDPFLAHYYALDRESWNRKLQRGRPDTDNVEYQYWHDNMARTMEELYQERSNCPVFDPRLDAQMRLRQTA